MNLNTKLVGSGSMFEEPYVSSYSYSQQALNQLKETFRSTIYWRNVMEEIEKDPRTNRFNWNINQQKK